MKREEVVTERELSKYLKVSVPCLKYWRSVGYGPIFSKTKRGIVVYEIAHITNWLSSCLVDPRKKQSKEEDFLIVDGAYEIYVSGKK